MIEINDTRINREKSFSSISNYFNGIEEYIKAFILRNDSSHKV